MQTCITILSRTDSKPAGKTYTVNSKTVADHQGRYIAQTVALSGDSATELLTAFSQQLEALQPHQIIILGHAPNMPARYYVVPSKDLPDPQGVSTAPDGLPAIARLKAHYNPSRLLLLDFDPDDRMPASWLAGDNERWKLLEGALNEFQGVARMTIASGSGRILQADGSVLNPNAGTHTYVVTDSDITANDLDSARTALQVRLWANDLGYLKPDKNGKPLRRCLFDESVWLVGREVFDGPPAAAEPLRVAPIKPEITAGSCLSVVLQASGDDERVFTDRTGARIVRKSNSQGVSSVSIRDHGTLQLSTIVETELGSMTVQQFLDSGEQRLRCQATFRKSSSWAGIVQRTAAGVALYDSGTGTSYRLEYAKVNVPGALDKALGELAGVDKADAQDHARAVVNRHVWRVPLQLSLSGLLDQVCKANNYVDRTDLEALASWRLERSHAVACRSVALSVDGVQVVGSLDDVQRGIEALGGSGIHVVKALHGAGKTQYLLRPIALAVRQAVAVAPRVSLVADLGERMQFIGYQSNEALGANKLAICLNSIINGQFNHSLNYADTILIDEVSRIIRECHTRKSTLGKDAKRVWDRLIELLSGSKLAVCVDADLSDLDIQILREAGLDLHVWEIRGKVEDKQALFVKADQAYAEIDQALSDDNGPILVVADSAKAVRGLAVKYRKQYPNKRIVDIQSMKGHATTGEPFVIKLLSDINNNVQSVDMLIVSPAVESGISLNVDHFKHHFALYHGVVEPTAFNQMLMRDRTAQQWTIGIAGNGINSHQTDAGSILNGLEACQRSINDLTGGMLQVKPATAYDGYCVRIQAETNESLNDYARALYWLLQARGWSVDSLMGGSTAGKEIRQDMKAELEAETVQAVLEAEDLSESQLEALEQEYQLSPADSAAILRGRIRATTGKVQGELGADDVALYQGGKLEQQVQLFEAATGALRGASLADVDEAQGNVPVALRAFSGARECALRDLISATGLDLETGSGQVDEARALQVWQQLQGSTAAAVLEHFQVVRFGRSAPEYPVRWLGGALGKLGVWLEATGGRGGRVYQLGRCSRGRLPGLDLMQAVVARRAAARDVAHAPIRSLSITGACATDGGRVAA